MEIIGFYSILGSQNNDTFKSTEIFIIAVLIGSGGAGILITSLSLTAQLIGKNTECSAFVYGAISFVDKLSNGQFFSQFILRNNSLFFINGLPKGLF